MDEACRRAVLIDARRNRNLGAAQAIPCLAGALPTRLMLAAQVAITDQVMKDGTD